MDDWDFCIPTSTAVPSSEIWFNEFHEEHEKAETDYFNSLMSRLDAGLERRATFTVSYEDTPKPDIQKKRKKIKPTVPRSPKLHTRRRLGLTRREKDGLTLNKQRKDLPSRNGRRLSFMF